MSDYIKREDAIKAFKRVLDEDFPYISEETPRERIAAIPSADVVEVIRCKDCKHHEDFLFSDNDNVVCWVHDVDIVVAKNGYCNCGEREEQEHE